MLLINFKRRIPSQFFLLLSAILLSVTAYGTTPTVSLTYENIAQIQAQYDSSKLTNPHAALKLAQKIEQFYLTQGDAESYANALFMVGYSYYEIGDYDKATAKLKEAVKALTAPLLQRACVAAINGWVVPLKH
ncbi:hypothetical protein LVD15_21640 [Fulvivirga maritima]|uniref:hypothetical protein n=1 Tax=Fulvivirga maritima TaxID=2904247 RepID=UPI001F31C780|nr:hypothetical protein [Fulvivirga maritima]UII25876.1 hypothetical protein LVD15_21640 [Fulvivirga maritima]